MWSSFPFVRITLAFLIGIVVGHYFEQYLLLASTLLLLLLMTYAFGVIMAPTASLDRRGTTIGCIGIVSIFLAGYVTTLLHKDRLFPDHLTYFIPNIEAYEGVATEDMQVKKRSHSVTVAIKKVRVQNTWQLARGKVKLYLPQSNPLSITYGDRLLILGAPQPTNPPRNPNEFDYQSFLSYANIYHQHFVKQAALKVIGHSPPHYLKALSLKMRAAFEKILTTYIVEKEAASIALALVLGIKDELAMDTKKAYANAGAMHILAVSGLHVGIIYWLLSMLLMRFRSIGWLRWLSLLTSIAILWLYAFVTGLSPSALRATTMFTFLIIAQCIGRQPNIYNSLAASAFLLLLFDPLLLFSVSFQLSYLAVLGIAYLQPKIYRWFSFDNAWLDKLWLLSSVSLAAQLATTPISLYYFHQFPTYFILANWVVVPAAMPIVGLGFLVLLTNAWQGLSSLLGWILGKVIVFINQFIFFINHLPGSLIDTIFLDKLWLFLLYGFLIALLGLLQTRQYRYVLGTAAMVLFLLASAMKTVFDRQQQKMIIFYSINQHQAVSFVAGTHSRLCVDQDLQKNERKYTYHIAPHQQALGIAVPTIYSFEEAVKDATLPLKAWKGLYLATWQGKKLVWLYQKGLEELHFAKKIKIDMLIIEKNAVSTLQPLLDRFDFDQLIIGTTNKRYLASQLKKQAETLPIKVHLLQQEALAISL